MRRRKKENKLTGYRVATTDCSFVRVKYGLQKVRNKAYCYCTTQQNNETKTKQPPIDNDSTFSIGHVKLIPCKTRESAFSERRQTLLATRKCKLSVDRQMESLKRPPDCSVSWLPLCDKQQEWCSGVIISQVTSWREADATIKPD